MDALAEFFDDFQIPPPQTIKQGRQYYYSTIKEFSEDQFSIGVFIGEMKRMFQPSAGILPLLQSSPHKITVNDKSAYLFTCGRDIFDDAVTNKEDKCTRKGLVIVKTKENYLIGIAKKTVKGKQVMYKNILDIGSFLRREKNR